MTLCFDLWPSYFAPALQPIYSLHINVLIIHMSHLSWLNVLSSVVVASVIRLGQNA